MGGDSRRGKCACRDWTNTGRETCIHGDRTGIRNCLLQVYYARLPVDAHVDVVYAEDGNPTQRHRFRNAATVVRPADHDTCRALIAMRRLGENNAINRLRLRIEHTYGEQIRFTGYKSARNVDREWSFPPRDFRPAPH